MSKERRIMKLKKPFLALVSLAAIIASAFSPLAGVSAWGPDNRPTYTNNKPADYATFNSITDNVAVGDERNFVRIREAGTDQNFGDEIQVVPGHEYEVYIYYHNNAATDTNASGLGVATNVQVASAYPPTVNTNERGMVSGIISWSYVTPDDPNNAKEGKVWDEAYVTTATDGTVLKYKTGTAIIHNSGKANGSVLPDNLFTEGGTPIGFNKLTGTLPGCAEYSGHITYTLVAEKVESTLDKMVSLDGENWSNEVTAKPGDFVTYKVQFKNTGNTNFTNVIFKDTHDEDLLLRSGSIKVYDVNNTDGKTIDDILDISGYNVGDVRAGALVQIIYQMQVREGASACGRGLKNTISVAYNSKDQQSDSTIVNVEECNTPTPPTPPDTPKEIVETGPLEITMAAIVALGIGAGGFYLFRTRRALKTVKNTVVGGEPKADAPKTVDPSVTETKAEPKAPVESTTPAEPQEPVVPFAPEAPIAPINPETPVESEDSKGPEAPKTN